jgi:hypothetical protein
MTLDPTLLDGLKALSIGALTWLAKSLWDGYRGKLRTLRYSVAHTKIAQAGSDQIFGNVEVAWQGAKVQNLGLSTLKIENTTLHDFENLELRVFSAAPTLMLNGRSAINGTTRYPRYTAAFAESLKVPQGESPNAKQYDSYYHSREYIVPVFNRGEVLEITFLVSVLDQSTPGIWVDSLTKGVRCNERRAPRQISSLIFGVPISIAAAVGSLLSIAGGIVVVWIVPNIWLAVAIALLLGWVATLLGASVVRAYREARRVILH